MSVRIGNATAWSGDRLEPTAALLERGELDFLFFDSMSETTMSGTQIRLRDRPEAPRYDPFLGPRLRPILPVLADRHVRVVSNQGWLDPVGAARALAGWAREDGVRLRVAAVAPDLGSWHELGLRVAETGEPLDDPARAVSFEPYLGAWEIVAALDAGADVVLTGRVADASMVVGPLAHALGWARDDWDVLGRGVAIGHLLECGTQATGGNLADPGYVDVPGLEDPGHPIAEIEGAEAWITKTPGTGGVVDRLSCTAQLLWEVGDPSRYLNPDVTADFTTIRLDEVGPDRVAVVGGGGGPPPETLKALVGFDEGWFAEEMLVFAGPGALDRADLAERILRARLQTLALAADDLRFDRVGVDAVHREASPPAHHVPWEVALRVALRSSELDEARKLGTAVAPMAVSGPVGTGKWGTLAEHVRPVIGMWSTAVPRAAIGVDVEYFDT